MQITTAPEMWLNKEEVAETLKVSVRQVERLARSGRIERRYTKPGDGRRYGQTTYSLASVAAVERERAAGVHIANQNQGRKPGVPEVVQTVDVPPPPTPEQQRLAEAEETAAMARALAVIPWLTLDQAAVVSGLTKAWLLTSVLCPELGITVRDMGRKARGGRWRFFRPDLEKAR